MNLLYSYWGRRVVLVETFCYLFIFVYYNIRLARPAVFPAVHVLSIGLILLGVINNHFEVEFPVITLVRVKEPLE
jgi:hypothetical protein